MKALQKILAVLCLAVVSTVAWPDQIAVGTTKRVPLAVVVAASSTLRDLSRAMLRRVFLGEPTEHHGTRFIPLNYPPADPLRIAFDEAALGFDASAAGRYWIDRRIRGQGLPPRVIPNALLLREVVARLPGSIGYLPLDKLGPNVRAISIDGYAPTDPNYPLGD